MSSKEGRIKKVAGPVVIAENMKGTEMYEVVKVGEEELFSEVIELNGDEAVIQCYEETSGVSPGEKVIRTGDPLSVELGPGLMSSIYDGIQRPLDSVREKGGDFIPRGVEASAVDYEKKWKFEPKASEGDEVEPKDIIGEVPETNAIDHKVMVPPGKKGKIKEIKKGKFTVKDTIAVLETDEGKEEITMLQKWPVREYRPYKEKLDPDLPLITGQRVLDTFFPLTKGGTAAVPGGFGTGKTVLQHQISKWADADVIIFIGCGERGNEMAEVLEEFPELEDPRTGESLMKRTILLANTSNMPVAARESCIYTGITMAEYYRDMGYDVALQADSTSRWAEALREISGRLEEMPGEEGYPAYLASRLSEFYERAGRVKVKEDRKGSVSVVGAVSPPGGDFSEPVTQNTLRIVKVFWALSTELKDKRHFPAIDWLESYSLYTEGVQGWWADEVTEGWLDLREQSLELLQKEDELQEVVQLVGPDALPEKERVVLDTTRMLREDFLQQNAFHEVHIVLLRNKLKCWT